MVAQRDLYEPVARDAASLAGIDGAVFVCLIAAESGFDPAALSPAGAQGIAQLMPGFHPGVNPWNPTESLHYAARLLRGYLTEFGADYRLGIAAYNAGPTAVRAYGGIPPFPETQALVASVLSCAGGAQGDARRMRVWALGGLVVGGVALVWLLG